MIEERQAWACIHEDRGGSLLTWCESSFGYYFNTGELNWEGWKCSEVGLQPGVVIMLELVGESSWNSIATKL